MRTTWRTWIAAAFCLALAPACGDETSGGPDEGADADAGEASDDVRREGDAEAPDGVPDDGTADGEGGADGDVPGYECPELTGGALSFDGVDDHVDVASTSGLGLAEFTIEAWVRWSGEGTGAGSGVGGVRAIPLVAKGRGEDDGSNIDCNYLFGIEETSHVLAADFEDMASGANHPVTGTTPLEPNEWHHVAATYDGAAWVLYVDGEPDGGRTVDATPRRDSIQHVALGTAFDSTGAREGAFGGELDEVRVWDHALTEAEIAAGLALEIDAGEGLVARWALDETSGTTAADSAGAHPGAVVGAAWSPGGAPFAVIGPPSISLIGPADGAVVPAAGAELAVWVDARGDQPMTVEFSGREIDPDFAVVVLPDTQFYSASHPETFVDQTRWVRENAATYNIRAVLHAGDITDNGAEEDQWVNAEAAMAVLEGPLPGLPDGMPYGLAVGNHDQRGSTALFNRHFGAERFAGRSYYGGHYGSDNDNHWIRFDAGSTPYLALFLEYDEDADAEVLAWAHEVLAAHPDHRALVTLHYLIGRGDPGAWGAQGRATYEALKDLTQIDLLLCGHIAGEGRRTDTASGHAIHTLLADYQSRTGGGDGWLRLILFSPASGEIHVRTLTTLRDEWETDADSDFVLPYESSAAAEEPIARIEGVAPGSEVRAPWAGLEAGRRYQWSVAARNCFYLRTSPSWTLEAR
jgi:hypothetical protein